MSQLIINIIKNNLMLLKTFTLNNRNGNSFKIFGNFGSNFLSANVIIPNLGKGDFSVMISLNR